MIIYKIVIHILNNFSYLNSGFNSDGIINMPSVDPNIYIEKKKFDLHTFIYIYIPLIISTYYEFELVND